MISLAVAYLAPIINCLYQIPQLFKTIQTKRVKDIYHYLGYHYFY